MQLWQYYTILHVYESPNRYKVSAYYITCQDLYMHSYLPTYPFLYLALRAKYIAMVDIV